MHLLSVLSVYFKKTTIKYSMEAEVNNTVYDTSTEADPTPGTWENEFVSLKTECALINIAVSSCK